MKKRVKLISIFLPIFCFIFFITAMVPIEVSATVYPFQKYYHPEDDNWANLKRVNMDGYLEFTVPNMDITSIDLIVYEMNASQNQAPQIKSLKNADNREVVFKEKAGDKETYTYYTVSNVSKGKWKLQLKDGSWENIRVYLIFQSAYKAKYRIDQEIKNPDSGNYQIMIQLYDKEDKQLSLKNRTVNYVIDDQILMSPTQEDEKYSCYLGGATLDENDRNILGDSYTCHITVTASDGTIVLLQAEKADKKVFKEILNAYTPSLWERFRAKPAGEQRMIVMMICSLIIFSAIVILVLKKTNLLRNRLEKMKKEKEERYQQAVRAAKKTKESFENCFILREEIWKLQEYLEPYEIWVRSLLSVEERRKNEKILEQEFFHNLEICNGHVQGLKNNFQELNKRKKGFSESKQKEILERIVLRRQVLQDTEQRLTSFRNKLDGLKQEIQKFESRKMFRDISINVLDHNGKRYSGEIEAQELGLPRRKGIQNINGIMLRGKEKILFSHLKMHGLALSIGFSENDSRQELILISNKELFCDEEDMEVLRIQKDVQLGPYQYMYFEGLELYIRDNQNIRFRIMSQ